MKITPLNIAFALILGYLVFTLLDFQQASHNNAKSLAYLLFDFALTIKLWQILCVFGMVVFDVLFRVLLPDIKKLWLVESLFIVIIAATIHFVNLIIPTSLFN